MNLESGIRNIPDFPKPGIQFKDICPLLADAKLLNRAIDAMCEPYLEATPDVVIGIESRGFIFGAAVARQLNCGFAPMRKPGKLPYKTFAYEYELEYGKDKLELHIDAFAKGAKVLIVDDLLATGGTAGAAIELVKKMEGNVIGISFLIELKFLEGRKRLGVDQIHSVIQYD